MMVVHDKNLSDDGFQTFVLKVARENNEPVEYAEMMAWFAIGHDGSGNYDEMNSYQSGKWNCAFMQAMKTEALKLAMKCGPIKRLYKNDVDFDINPLSWIPIQQPCDVRITIEDNRIAALFKITWCVT
jgi:hypothetical protein